MFKSYKSSYNLDLWEALDRNEISNYRKEFIPENIDKFLKLLDNNYISEGIEVEGKYYDNLDDVYHVGTAKEFSDPKQLLKVLYPFNIKSNYRKTQDYPMDFYIEAIDPKCLKRIGFMLIYKSIPFDKSGFEKKECRLILYKGKAFAAEVINKKHRLAFMIDNIADVEEAIRDKALRVSWNWEKKVVDDLTPSQIYNEIRAAVAKLKSANYRFVDDDTLVKLWSNL